MMKQKKEKKKQMQQARSQLEGRFIMLYSCFFKRSRNYLRGFLMAACAAARRAIGTRKGEQLT